MFMVVDETKRYTTRLGYMTWPRSFTGPSPEMDLPPIGAHCSLPSCRQLDLLPIRCRCDKQFCKDHILPDAHQCPVDPSQALKDASTQLQKLHRCAFASCAKPSLAAYASDSTKEEGRTTSALCPRCTLAYCAS
jgi:hypothetical protein